MLFAERTSDACARVIRRSADNRDIVALREILAELGEELTGRLEVRPERAI